MSPTVFDENGLFQIPSKILVVKIAAHERVLRQQCVVREVEWYRRRRRRRHFLRAQISPYTRGVDYAFFINPFGDDGINYNYVNVDGSYGRKSPSTDNSYIAWRVDSSGVVYGGISNGGVYRSYGRRYRRTRASSDMHGTWSQVVFSAATTSTTLAVPTVTPGTETISIVCYAADDGYVGSGRSGDDNGVINLSYGILYSLWKYLYRQTCKIFCIPNI